MVLRHPNVVFFHCFTQFVPPRFSRPSALPSTSGGSNLLLCLAICSPALLTCLYQINLFSSPVSILLLISSFLILSVFTIPQHFLQYYISVTVILFFHFFFIASIPPYIIILRTMDCYIICCFYHFIPYSVFKFVGAFYLYVVFYC